MINPEFKEPIPGYRPEPEKSESLEEERPEVSEASQKLEDAVDQELQDVLKEAEASVRMSEVMDKVIEYAGKAAGGLWATAGAVETAKMAPEKPEIAAIIAAASLGGVYGFYFFHKYGQWAKRGIAERWKKIGRIEERYGLSSKKEPKEDNE